MCETLAVGLDEPEPQHGEVTYAAKIEPDELRLDWAAPAEQLARVVRVGRAWTTWRGKRLLVLDARPVAGTGSPPGELAGVRVASGTGALALAVVQPEGRPAMPAEDWVRGARIPPGERLGP